MAAPYFVLIREMKNAYNHRLRLVESAQQRGIKPTARLFTTTVPTVRKWLRRYQQQGPSGLVALSRARHQQSQKTPPTTEAQLVELRKTFRVRAQSICFIFITVTAAERPATVGTRTLGPSSCPRRRKLGKHILGSLGEHTLRPLHRSQINENFCNRSSLISHRP